MSTPSANTSTPAAPPTASPTASPSSQPPILSTTEKVEANDTKSIPTWLLVLMITGGILLFLILIIVIYLMMRPAEQPKGMFGGKLRLKKRMR
jgi:hypothetical protein